MEELIWSPAEALNVIFGGIAGLILVWASEWILNNIRQRRIRSRFLHLESKPDVFDWINYNIQGRDRDKDPNGSTTNVRHVQGMELEIRVKEADQGDIKGPVWVGYLRMNDFSRGGLTFKYEGAKYEYQSKQVYLSQETEDGKIYDYFILVGDGEVYGTELIRRLRRGDTN